MHEQLAKECCNYSAGKCSGGMFKVISGICVYWEDTNKSGKKCLITENKICDWFEKIVKPGISSNDYLASKRLAAYDKAIIKRNQEGKTNGNI